MKITTLALLLGAASAKDVRANEDLADDAPMLLWISDTHCLTLGDPAPWAMMSNKDDKKGSPYGYIATAGPCEDTGGDERQ